MLLKFCQSVKFHQVLSHYLGFNQTSKSVDNFNRTNYLKQLNKSECKKIFLLKSREYNMYLKLCRKDKKT